MCEKCNLTRGRDSRDSLEMCFFYTSLFRKNAVEFKQSLQKLVLIGQQDIKYVPAISQLIQLEELWIIECGIKEAPYLQNHSNLKELYLYANQIEHIPNLTGCTRLEILHMSNNSIQDFKNLDKIPSLQELTLADNKIQRLHNDFSAKSQLRYINLSGNPLYCIQDTKNLVVLQKLNSVVFADPLYRECPLSRVCNYRPYIIKHLPHIKKLDHYPICKGEKRWVAYFFKKQASYYNMILHMQFNFCLESLKDKYIQYQRMIGDVKGQFCAIHEQRETQSKRYKDLMAQLQLLNDQIEGWEEQFIADLKTYKQQFSLKMLFCGNIKFIGYSPKQETGVVHFCQNVLEHSLCSSTREIGIKGVVVHNVIKVMHHKITSHNRWEKESDALTLDTNKGVFKILTSWPGIRSVGDWPFEFFESELFKTQEILVTDCLAIADRVWLHKKWASENQLRANSSYSSTRICILIRTSKNIEAERTTNKKACNDVPMNDKYDNIEKYCCWYRLATHKIKGPMFVIEYQYMSTESTKIDLHCNGNNNYTPCEEHKNLYAKNGLEMINARQDNLLNLVKICLSGQTVTTIDIDFELPHLRELDVSYNRISVFPNGKILKHLESLDISFNSIKVVSITEVLTILANLNISWNDLSNCMSTCETVIKFTPNLSVLNIQFNPFEDRFNQKQIQHMTKSYLPQLNFVTTTSFRCQSAISKSLSLCTEYTCKQSNFPRTLNHTEKSSKLTKVKMKEQEQSKYIHVQNDSSVVSFIFKKKTKVKQICASSCFLMKVPITGPMKCLTKLNLSSNFISNVGGFTQHNFPVLKYLDLSQNLITSLLLMQHFHSLQEFYCAHNQINTILDIENLRSWYMLNVLDLYKNPVDANDLCKTFILSHLPNIKYISGKYVEYTEILEAKYAFGIVLDINILSCLYKSNYLQAITQLSLTNCSLKKVHLYSDMIPYLESLDLSRNKISVVWGLHSFQYLHTLCLSYNTLESFGQDSKDTTNLTFLNLCTLMLDHNNITCLENLVKRTMPRIKHVFLNDNNIKALGGIAGCPSLESLILDENGIETLTVEVQEDNNLKLLSLENNKIKSLQFIESFKKLEKLYLANNCIDDESNVAFLKSATRLKELTLTGNLIYPLVYEDDRFQVTISPHWRIPLIFVQNVSDTRRIHRRCNLCQLEHKQRVLLSFVNRPNSTESGSPRHVNVFKTI